MMIDRHRVRTNAMIAAVRGMVAALATGPAQGDDFQPRSALQALSGVYASSAPEAWYGGAGTRRFSFAGGRWELTFVHALDPAMTKKDLPVPHARALRRRRGLDGRAGQLRGGTSARRRRW